MKIGIDLIKIEKLKDIDLKKIFNDEELQQNPRHESLAGVFAAKEAFFKALGKKVDWHDVWVVKDASGKPAMFSTLTQENIHLSISHEDGLAVSLVVIE